MPSLFVLLFTLGCLLGLVNASSRPYELLIYRDRNSFACSLATLKSVQEYRGLKAYGFLGTKELSDTEERLRFLQRSREEAWSHLLQLCGPQDTWGFPVLTDASSQPLVGSQALTELKTLNEQDIFTLPQPTRELFPLEFELQPLVKSGHSSNRVDLMFFSDGCACSTP